MTKSPHPRAHIDEEAPTPEHTYVERIHTPRRHCASKDPMTEEEWADLKHAHIDDDAMSPSGLVDRVQTPLRQPSAVGEEEPIVDPALLVAEEEEEERRARQRLRTRLLLALLTHTVSFAAGAGLAIALMKHRIKTSS